MNLDRENQGRWADKSAMGTINRPLQGSRIYSRYVEFFVKVHYRVLPFYFFKFVGRKRNAINPPSITNVKQKPTAHNGPIVFSKKPKNQPQKTVLMPLAKRRIPATEPGNLPARSLPMARHVAKMGESPILVKAIARVAIKALGLSAVATSPTRVTRVPSITSFQEPRRRINSAAPRRLRVDSAHIILLRAAAIAGVCANATWR